MKTEVRVSVHAGHTISSYFDAHTALSVIFDLIDRGVGVRIMYSAYLRRDNGELAWLSDHETRKEAEDAAKKGESK